MYHSNTKGTDVFCKILKSILTPINDKSSRPKSLAEPMFTYHKKVFCIIHHVTRNAQESVACVPLSAGVNDLNEGILGKAI